MNDAAKDFCLLYLCISFVHIIFAAVTFCCLIIVGELMTNLEKVF
jgi:hypothetical protein